MCCDETSDNRVNHLRKCAPSTPIYSENVSKFEKLSVTIHVRNLRILTTELYKTKENLAAPIMHEIFE